MYCNRQWFKESRTLFIVPKLFIWKASFAFCQNRLQLHGYKLSYGRPKKFSSARHIMVITEVTSLKVAFSFYVQTGLLINTVCIYNSTGSKQISA